MSDIGYWGIVLAYVALVIAMGMLLDSSSIMLIVIPLFMPIMKALAIDPIWFGIITVLAVEVGLLTPPFGLSVYVIKGTSPDRTLKLGEIFAGSAPFAVTDQPFSDKRTDTSACASVPSVTACT